MKIASLAAAGMALVALSGCTETYYGDRGYYDRDYYGGYYDRGYYGNYGNYGLFGSSDLYGSRRYRDRDRYYSGGHRYDEHYRKPDPRPVAPPPVSRTNRGPYIGGLGRDDLPFDKVPARDLPSGGEPSGVNLNH